MKWMFQPRAGLLNGAHGGCPEYPRHLRYLPKTSLRPPIFRHCALLRNGIVLILDNATRSHFLLTAPESSQPHSEASPGPHPQRSSQHETSWEPSLRPWRRCVLRPSSPTWYILGGAPHHRIRTNTHPPVFNMAWHFQASSS